MARPIRHVATHRYYLLTNRTNMGQYLLRPDPEARRIMLGCLAKAVAEHGVELVCFCFMSNHFHLIARFPEGNMAEFMEQFQGQLADRINSHRGRRGTVFPTRYADQALLDDQVLREKIAYVLNNPVEAELVAKAGEWDGVSSMGLHQSGDPLEGEWLDHRQWHNLQRRQADYDRQEAMVDYTIELHLPDALEGGFPEARREALLEVVAEHRRELYTLTTGDPDQPPNVLGFEAAVDQDWWGRPEDPPSVSTNYLGVATDAGRTADYHDKRREISEAYRVASRKSPGVAIDAFPAGTYPPACRHCVGPPAAG